MNTITLTKLRQLKFYGMHNAFKTAIESGQIDGFTIDQFIAHLIEAEWDDRRNRKIQRYIKTAKFRYKAQLEKIVYKEHRELDQNKMMRLASLDFIKNGENLLITGSAGAGKSYIASALGYQACIEGYKVLYFNTSKLLAKLKMAKADGSYLKEITKIERHQLIILDDFGLQPMDNKSRMALLEIIEDRHEKGAVIITAQMPVSKWHEVIGEQTVADAIIDRLLHHVHRVELKGESMRRKRTKTEPIALTSEFNQ